MRSPIYRQGSDLMIRLEIFDWKSPDETTTISFRVTEMLLAIAMGKLPYQDVLTRVDNNFARQWLPQRDLDMNYVRNISPERLKEPVLGAWSPDETVILIDGSHRYMRKYLEGHSYITYWLIATEDWLPFATIDGIWPCK